MLNGFSVIDGEVLTFLVCHDTDGQEEKRQIWQRVEAILRDNGLFGMFSRTFYRAGRFSLPLCPHPRHAQAALLR